MGGGTHGHHAAGGETIGAPSHEVEETDPRRRTAALLRAAARVEACEWEPSVADGVQHPWRPASSSRHGRAVPPLALCALADDASGHRRRRRARSGAFTPRFATSRVARRSQGARPGRDRAQRSNRRADELGAQCWWSAAAAEATSHTPCGRACFAASSSHRERPVLVARDGAALNALGPVVCGVTGPDARDGASSRSGPPAGPRGSARRDSADSLSSSHAGNGPGDAAGDRRRPGLARTDVARRCAGCARARRGLTERRHARPARDHAPHPRRAAPGRHRPGRRRRSPGA